MRIAVVVLAVVGCARPPSGSSGDGLSSVEQGSLVLERCPDAVNVIVDGGSVHVVDGGDVYWKVLRLRDQRLREEDIDESNLPRALTLVRAELGIRRRVVVDAVDDLPWVDAARLVRASSPQVAFVRVRRGCLRLQPANDATVRYGIVGDGLVRRMRAPYERNSCQREPVPVCEVAGGDDFAESAPVERAADVRAASAVLCASRSMPMGLVLRTLAALPREARVTVALPVATRTPPLSVVAPPSPRPPVARHSRARPWPLSWLWGPL